jgi:outer membrane protein TolC
MLLLLFWASTMTNGQGLMNLKNCIEYGLSNHRSTIVYANESLAAKAKAKEVQAAYLPSINVNGSIDDNLKVQETIIPAGLFSQTDTRVAFTKQFGSNVTAQLDQTIYDQSLITGMKTNTYTKQQASLNGEQNQETIIYNVSTAYYQIFVYRQQLGLLHDNLQSYRGMLPIAIASGAGSEIKNGMGHYWGADQLYDPDAGSRAGNVSDH